MPKQDLHDSRTVMLLEGAAACVLQLLPAASARPGLGQRADFLLEACFKQRTGKALSP
jgi:hypothetical protein